MQVSSLEEIKTITHPLFDRFKIKKAAVFGSFARNEHRDQSDVDFLIDFLERYDFLDIIALKQDLEEKLERKVDLITFTSLKNEGFDAAVLKEAATIYEKN